jgi:4-amino-4-deoxy-L-arabinose transferase-like glycosyltransferase
MPGHTLPIVTLVVRIAPLEGQTMFFVTCALAALTRAIENI